MTTEYGKINLSKKIKEVFKYGKENYKKRKI